ncbi:hypothetical protein [Patulibacter defluvii]|uniref:hypothetical protein n=1 Tax=Patulibacter defluvii TaxID=3095358 RepID=UPI002A753BF9|nr:hypothetical protein [Patulibacter sp. DM4]
MTTATFTLFGVGLAGLSIPFFTAVIGYVTNWTGVWMLFNPLEFHGFRVPGMRWLGPRLPRRLRTVPVGLADGRFGWQGIIPSRAAKMGSIAVDKGLARLGGAADFYRELQPAQIAEHLERSVAPQIPEMVDETVRARYGGLWDRVPDRVRRSVQERAAQELPTVLRRVTDEIGEQVDEMLDIKLMVIRRMAERPQLANRVFQEVGERELRMIIRLGFVFGFLFGIPLVVIMSVFPHWWVVVLGGIVIGWVTNWLAIEAIFSPLEPRKIGPFTVHGLFIRRQHDVATIYASIIADEVLTVSNLADDLLHGPKSDRTRAMIERELTPVLDNALGRARVAVRAAVGGDDYASIGADLARRSTERALAPLADADLNQRQGVHIRRMLTDRMRELSHPEFAELLRAAMKEDEWLLLLHGGVLGIVGGLAHLAVFGTHV